MKKNKALLAKLILFSLAFAACGSETVTELSTGEEVYEARCSACHGADLEGRVGPALDADSIYSVPLALKKEGLCREILKTLNLKNHECDLHDWEKLIYQLRHPGKSVKVALVGKYIQLNDAYLSVVEALRHACIAQDASLDLHWINAEKIESNGPDELLNGMDAIVVPGGFGNRGVNGKIEAIKWAREQRVPFLGLCLGMQCAVIEWARNQAGFKDASSAELDPKSKHPVIHLLPEQQDVVDLGGTMRLGVYPCRLQANTIGQNLYKEEVVYERHRHRYEFNNSYRSLLIESGYVISGTSPDGRLVELIELKNHPYFIACQYHPEFLSRPGKPHPLFRGLIEAAQLRVPSSPSEALNSKLTTIEEESIKKQFPSSEMLFNNCFLLQFTSIYF